MDYLMKKIVDDLIALTKRVEALEKASREAISTALVTDLVATEGMAAALGREARIAVLEHTLKEHEKEPTGDTVHPEHQEPCS